MPAPNPARETSASPSAAPASPRQALLDDLAERVRRTVGEALDGHDRVALVDVPTHTNVGDSAIWLGELSALRQLGIEIAYLCDLDTFDPDALRRRAGDAPVLIHGGGNFGDLYPRHQAFRELVVRSFPDRRVVQLPQSVEFRDAEEARRAGAVLNTHPDCRLLLRDDRSLGRARELFDCPALLCPDAALCLPATTPSIAPEVGVLALLREDHESLHATPHPAADPREARTLDWLEEPPSNAVRSARRLAARLQAGGLFGRLAAGRIGKAWEVVARERVERGVRLLSRGSVVLTDRLHAHVLCLLAGIPHVVVPDRFGKVEAFVSTWSADVPEVHWAPDLDRGWATARRLAEEVRGA